MPDQVPQTRFRAALLDSATPVPEGLLDGQGRPAGRRFSVYRNNVAASLTEALEESFPVVRKLLGDENFKNISRVYLRAHPPSSPLMMYYGRSFPAFVQHFEPLAHLPYLADVARLELAQRESYHAADADPADASCLGELAPEELGSTHLALAPALRVVQSPWPIHAIWAFNMVPGAPKPTGGPQNVLITRPDFDPVVTPVDAGTTAFIHALRAGEPLANAHDAAVSTFSDFDLSNALGLLLSGHAITSITTERPFP